MTGSPQLMGLALFGIVMAALLVMVVRLKRQSRLVHELRIRIKQHETQYPAIEQRVFKEAELSAGNARLKIIAMAELDAQKITDSANQYCIEAKREIESHREDLKQAESEAMLLIQMAEFDAQQITDRAIQYCIEARREIEASRKELRQAELDALLLIQFADKHRTTILDTAFAEAEQVLNRSVRKIEELESSARMSVGRSVAEGIKSITDMQDQARKLEQSLQADYLEKKTLYDQLIEELAEVEAKVDLFHSGVYEPLYDFSDSESFRVEIKKIRDQQSVMISAKTAVLCTTNWTINDSVAQGRVWASRGIKLTLRAFNGAFDAALRDVKWNNIHTMIARIERERAQIDKLNVSNNFIISDEYFDLKLKELKLTHEHREKLKQEREERAASARAVREEQMLIRDMELAEQEELKYQALLDEARKVAASAHGAELEAYEIRIEALQASLAEAHSRFVRAQAMAEMTRSGWVYIISNVGSFGPDIVKIGLTRRLDPMDRVRELGAASVPFLFDTHAMIYSDDAPGLERKLHAEFAAQRVNASNFRKEFFRVSLEEVERAVRKLSPDAPFIRDIEAQEYQETLALRNTRLEQSQVLKRHAFPDSL